MIKSLKTWILVGFASLLLVACGQGGGGAGSCAGNCGNNAGDCWCDSQCEYYGDCCSDYYDECREGDYAENYDGETYDRPAIELSELRERHIPFSVSRDLLGYNVYRNGEAIAFVTTTSYLDDGVAVEFLAAVVFFFSSAIRQIFVSQITNYRERG